MNFRPYDILTQLIPGILLVGFVIFGTNKTSGIGEMNAASAAFGTVVAFVVGYIVNGFGHIVETTMSKRLSEAVLKAYRKNDIKLPLSILKPFTKLKYVDKKSKDLENKSFSDLFDEVKAKQHQRLDWLNQDKKFARSLIVTAIVLILMCITLEVKKEVSEFYPVLLGFSLLLTAIYRYCQSSIDYTIWVIKFYQNKDVWNEHDKK